MRNHDDRPADGRPSPAPDGEPGTVSVVDNAEERRFEARAGHRVLGFVEYRPAANRLILVHTNVDPSMEGRGIGSLLAAGALDAVRARGLRATVHCPFIGSWLERHPEYEDLLAP